MEAILESRQGSSTLSPPPLETAATGTRTVQRFDLARTLAAAREPVRATARMLRAPEAAVRTAKMVAFDRVLRPAEATASPQPERAAAWALAASVSLVLVTSFASAAAWALLFPHV